MAGQWVISSNPVMRKKYWRVSYSTRKIHKTVEFDDEGVADAFIIQTKKNEYVNYIEKSEHKVKTLYTRDLNPIKEQ